MQHSGLAADTPIPIMSKMQRQQSTAEQTRAQKSKYHET